MADPTGADFLTRVRDILQDTGPGGLPYRHSDAKLLRYLNDALAQVIRLRPDYFVSVDYDIPEVTSTATSIPIPWRLVYPTVMYIVHLVMLGDDEFTNDGRALGVLAQAEKLLTGRAF